ncbi:MAG: amino acid adenylation domain-containing protein, partial [Lachnospiraceae bacterium]|nr:amino acid adenylation domain-containing protein [Lachnospiraceae bacterium]
KDILQKRTPKSIALCAVKEEENNYQQGEVTGKIQDTPIMRQFRLWSLGKPEHFNQSTMVPVQADTDVIKKALNELVRHHDILRAVYRDGGLEILSYEESRKYDFFEYDLKDCENLESKIHDLCTEIQSGIKLEEGPLMRVGLFDTTSGRYMMICIHHYAVDGVSWRILLEDFDIAVEACQKNQKIKLPAKTASFIEWTELLREYSKTEEVEEEREFWNNFEDNKEAIRLQISESDITDGINNYAMFELSTEMTRNLLRKAGKAYNTQINDLLLAALGVALRKHTGQESIAVGIEGHGRETIHKPVNTDRTVGWFTSLYPVVVDCKNDIEESIVTTKDMLREVPNKGIGYGLLYDTNISEYVDVYFNYLGEMDSEENSKNSAGLSTGENSSRKNKVPGYFNLNALVTGGKFICNLSYNNCTKTYAEEFINLYKESLEAVVEWCLEQKETHVTESDMYMLTPLQEGMYFHNQLDDEDTSYLLQSSFKTNVRIDVACLRQSLDCLAKKYETLKTSFVQTKSKGIIKQYIVDNRKIELTCYKYEENCAEETINEYSAKDLERGFDLKEDSLMRVALLSFADCDVLFISSHHIIVDGWCNPLVFGDLVRFYNLIMSGEGEKAEQTASEEKEQILSFREYVEWIQKIKKSENEKFWDSYLEDYESMAEITPIEKVETVTTKQVAEEYVVIDKITTTKLNALAKNCDATVSTVAQLAVGILLQKHCGTDDVLLGNVVSGRNVPLRGIETAVGMFINTVPLRIRAKSKEETIKSMLLSLQASNNESVSYDHAALGGMKVGRENVSEYIKHLFVFENYPGTSGDEQEYLGLQMESIGAREQTNYDISFAAYDQNDSLVFKLSYNPSKYTDGNIKIIASHLRNIVEQIADDATKSIKNVKVYNEKERELILNDFNDTDADYPSDKTVVELFEEQVAKTPDNVAVVFEGESLTYAELNAKANSLAYKLRELGVKPDDFVALLTERSLEMIVGIYGIIKAGGAYVPIDPNYPEDRIAYMLEDSAAKAVLVYGAEIETNIPVIDLADSEVYLSAAQNPERVNKPNDLIYCIYTSGTTGKPKGVMIENRGVVNLCYSFLIKYYTDDTRNISLVASYTFDASVQIILSVILSGRTIYVIPDEYKVDAEKLLDFYKNNKIDVSDCTPAHLRIMLSSSHTNAYSLKYIFVGGEELTNVVAENIIKNNYCNNLVNVYGPTECTVDATSYEINADSKIVYIGKPISNLQIYIVNENSICGIGEPGELCISGAGLSRGYLNMPELTAKKFVVNPYGEGRMYHTGDLARWLPDGNIEYLGRIDEQVKIRGFRIELGEIESRIREIEGVADCAVIARAEASGEKAIFAYFTSNVEVSVSEIREKLSENLPEYMIPSYMMQIESIPVTRNGKLDKRALPEIEAKTENEYVAPENETEAAVCRAFETMLGIEKVGVNDSFFELGGDSIKAIRVVSKVRGEGYTITVKDVLQKRTPKSIALCAVREEENNYHQGEVTGKVQDTPIMRQFKLWPLGKPEHFNQAMMVPVQADTKVIKKALNELVRHHDILRAVLRDDSLEILSYEESRKYDFFEYDLKDCENTESKMYDLCTEIQSGINLEEGPLMRVGLFDTAKGRYMMICIHHYAVDGVSWRILLEDFDTAVEACQKNQKIKLPAKTASFIEWSELLKEYSETEELKEEKEFWNNFEDNKEVKRLQISESELTDYINNNVMFELSADMTRNLLRNAGKAYNTQINDLLLAALGVALRKHTGQESIAVGIEGHGRETIHKPVNTDRTV